MDPHKAWIEELAELRAAGRPCAMVVVTDVRGSAPREPGARMIVADGRLAWGTIGGGNLERQAIEHAVALAASGQPRSESVVYPLAEKTGQCCGGQVTLFFESFAWKRHTIAIFGAGHVGQALAGLTPWLKARVQLIDGRDEAELVPAPPKERPWELLCIDSPEAEIDRLPPDALVLVMTHSHALDLEVLARALRRDTFPFVGLIGSERKWQRFRKRLLARDFAPDAVDSIRCPIGLRTEGLRGSKDPAAIALATAAQLTEEMAVLDARESVHPPA